MSIQGTTDLYEQMTEVKTGKRGCIAFSKKAARAANIEWSFVEKSSALLDLKVTRDGKFGYIISK